jgi:hypothetical protein
MPELKFHPIADLFPLMQSPELDALVADIKANGLREKVDLYQGKILDGRNRYRALQRLGIDPSAADKQYFRKAIYAHSTGGEVAPHEQDNDDRARAYVISKNIHRRHLTAEQRRDLIAKLLKAEPKKSDRQIAETVKVDHKTVGAVRAEQEGRGEIPHVEERTDTKGRKQPAKKPPAKAPARAHKPAPHQPAHISQELGEQIGTIAGELVAVDVRLARELADVLLKPGVPTRLWHDLTELLDDSGGGGGSDPGTPAKTTNALGKPLSPQFDPNWKRKTKLTPIARLRTSQKSLRMTDAAATGVEAKGNGDDPEASAEAMKANLAALDDGSDVGPFPEILRRDRAQP